jgi:hypothetical protein
MDKNKAKQDPGGCIDGLESLEIIRCDDDTEQKEQGHGYRQEKICTRKPFTIQIVQCAKEKTDKDGWDRMDRRVEIKEQGQNNEKIG